MKQHTRRHRGLAGARLGLGTLAASGFLGGCGSADAGPSVADDSLLANHAFVAISREPNAARSEAVQKLQQGLGVAGEVGQPPARNNEFYLAINKNELGTRWFLSGYLKQYFPGGVAGGAAMSLGTRVVSFRIQNGKVFVFDVDNRKKVSETFDPQVVVDAYPIITNYDAFNRLPNSSQYVLVDPSAGLNDFDVVSDFYARGATASRFKVELSFLQRFRSIADGATFEEVFSGYSEAPDGARQDSPDPQVDPNLFRASGTLGIALRRYTEGAGFVPAPVVTNGNGFDLFFRSDPRIVPNVGLIEQNSIKWNIKPGMAPIKWVISDKVNAVQARYPEYDIIGALKAGIENWNEVFGFKALEASVASVNQSFADDDVNYFIYDEDPSNGFAFADWRSNPNTGEVRGASVYYNSIWLDYAHEYFEADPARIVPRRVRRAVPAVRWKPLQGRPLCTLEAPPFRQEQTLVPALPAGLTKKEKVEQWLTHIALHEIGHILGLRHNFKGSLVPPSSSVMDYLNDPDSIASSHPGTYDAAALKYLYNLSPSLPDYPVCTDEELELDTNCNLFDSTADPFAEVRPEYDLVVEQALAGTPFPASAERGVVNRLLQFIRSGDTSAIRLAAFEHMIAPVKVNPSRTPAPDVVTAGRIDAWERRMMARLFLDPDRDRGYFVANPDAADPVLGPALIAELQAILVNGDRIRSYLSRRTMVDILKKVQLAGAYRALRDAKSALEASRPTVPPDEAIDLDDLIARVDRAITPYYD